MSQFLKICALFLIVLILSLPAAGHADELQPTKPHRDWQVSLAAGLIVAPAFSGSKSYSLLAVPDLRVAYKDQFFANMKDGIGYAVIRQDGWRVGPVLTYTFRRSEKDGGSVFRVAGGDKSALQGMGEVEGTTSLGVFTEYSQKPYTVQLHLHKGVTGHRGMVAEGKVTYGGTVAVAGPPLIYAVGPRVKFGDVNFVNAYWGVSGEQSARSGLAQYHAPAGLVSYGVGGFVMMPLTRAVSLSLLAGYDRLAPVIANSPFIQQRGTPDQLHGGLFVSYAF